MKGFRLHIWGERGCFTRPEFKTERVSYDVITPSAARNILQAIHWKPAIEWIVDRIRVCNPIEFGSMRVNEVGSKISANKVKSKMKEGNLNGLGLDTSKDRQQRAMNYLRNPSYVIEAHFELTERAGPEDTEAKHASIFDRRASKGQCYHQPFMGVRDFPANFRLLKDGEMPEIKLIEKDRDFGWMLWDLDYKNGNDPIPYRATMKDGVIEVSATRRGSK